MSSRTQPQIPYVRLPVLRNANEIFGALYGINVSPRAMIKAFSPIRLRFRFRSAAIFLVQNDRLARFDLPSRYRAGRWEPPEPMADEDLEELAELHLAVNAGRSATSLSIVDVAHRQVGRAESGETLWSLLYSCTMPPPEPRAAKRMTGDIKILLNNEGHEARCIYRDAVGSDIITRSAVEDHDLIAIYASYFDHMLRDLSFVPMALIQAEWNKALHHQSRVSGGDARDRAGLPWGLEAPAETPTVTIALDLRNSTFAMQQTRDRRGYAKWLEGVAELARRITLQNGGIFDKFTGDGMICHFVYPVGEPDEKAGEAEAIRSAVICAAELVHAIQLHIENVHSLLKFRSRTFGPAIGMAVDMAAWSLDRDGKPVVVGPGIVNACRLDGGVAGDITLTNDLKDLAASLMPNLKFEEYELGGNHKDFGVREEAMCWQISYRTAHLGRSMAKIQAEVDHVWGGIRRLA